MDKPEGELIPFPIAEDEDDFEYTDEQLAEVLRSLARYQSIKGKPVFRLEELLKRTGVEHLRRLGRSLHVRGLSKLRKAELITAIAEAWHSLDVERWLLMLPQEEWEAFQRHAMHRIVMVDEADEDALPALPVPEAMVFSFYDRQEQAFYSLIPEELRQRYIALGPEARQQIRSLKQQQERYQLYLEALVYLYDFFRISEVQDVMAHYGQALALPGMDAYDGALLAVPTQFSPDYMRLGPFVVNRELYEMFRDDLGTDARVESKLADLERIRRVLPLKLPGSSDALLEGEEYLLPQGTVMSLMNWLMAHGLERKPAQRVVNDLVARLPIREGRLFEEQIRAFAALREEALDDQEQEAFVRLIEALHNNYRYPQSAGYSPLELEAHVEALARGNAAQRAQEQQIRADAYLVWPIEVNLQHEQPRAASTAPGRNALCPCGSGRKYKHCCGRR